MTRNHRPSRHAARAATVTRVQNIERHAGAAAAHVVSRAPEGGYGLTDLFEASEWRGILVDGLGIHALNGTIHGAAEALRVRDLDPVDLAFPLPSALAAVTEEDVMFARRWLLGALAAPDPDEEFFRQTGVTLAARGWSVDSVRITSLTLAVLGVAFHSAATDQRAVAVEAAAR